MEWPSEIVLIRHATSLHENIRNRRRESPLYRRFLAALKSDPRGDMEETRKLVRIIRKKFGLNLPNPEMPLVPEALTREIEPTARGMAEVLGLPHAVFVSPYTRCQLTWEGLKQGWPELGTVETQMDACIRTQAHGVADQYYDPNLFFFFYPEEKEPRYRLGLFGYRYPGGGETIPDVRVRLRKLTHALRTEFVGRRVWVITHSRVILALRMEWEGISEEEFNLLESDETLKPIPCGVTRYMSDDDGPKLDFYNRRFY